MILYIVMGAAWMLFGKVQPVEKWQGLTLFDKGEVIQLPKNN